MQSHRDACREQTPTVAIADRIEISLFPAPDRRLVALCLLCAVTMLAGCAAISGGDGSLPDNDEINETYRSLDAYSATFVFNSSGDTPESFERVGPSRIEGEIIVRPGTGETYREQRRGDGSNRRVFVSNGTLTWVYNESENKVQKTETTETDNQRQQLYQLVTRINRNEGDDGGEPAFPIAPIGVGGGFGGDADSGSAAGLNISTTASYEGTETVDGREAHVLTVESVEKSEIRGRWTYYLDTEWYVTLRSTSNVTVDGRQTRTSFRLQNVTFNPEIPADQFEFTPPGNATIIDPKSDIERYESPEQLGAVTDLRVPDPEVPERFEFDEARRSLASSVESLSLRYTSDVSTLVVSRQNITADRPPSDRGQEVQVGDRTGVYEELPRQNQLRWQCSDTTQFIFGLLSRETLVDIAESIDC